MRPDLAHSRKFYGRTKGKSLRPLQQVRLTRDLPALGVAGVSHDENPRGRWLIRLIGLMGGLIGCGWK